MKEKQQKAFETLDEYLQDISGLTDHQYHWIKIAMEDYAKRYASSLQPSQVDEEGIKALAKKWIETNWSNGNYDDHCMDDVYNAMVEMYKAAASSIPSNGEWISVKDRLPSKGERAFVCTDNWVCACCYINEFNEWKLAYDGSLFHGNITHWQPLPAPPPPIGELKK